MLRTALAMLVATMALDVAAVDGEAPRREQYDRPRDRAR